MVVVVAIVCFPLIRVNDILSISLLRLKPVHRVKGFARLENCIVSILATQVELDYLLPRGEVISESSLLMLSVGVREGRFGVVL